MLGSVAAREEAEDREQDGEGSDAEARRPRLPRDPSMPTKKEREEHACTHWPTRPWCRHCMAGKGVASPHRSATPEEQELRREGVPTISVDHCFLGSERDAEERGEQPFLILHDSKSEALYCIPVSSKATTAWVVMCVRTIIEELGYGGMRIGFKSDNAEELIALRKRVAELRTNETVPIIVPVRVSQSNGAIERAVRTWQG